MHTKPMKNPFMHSCQASQAPLFLFLQDSKIYLLPFTHFTNTSDNVIIGDLTNYSTNTLKDGGDIAADEAQSSSSLSADHIDPAAAFHLASAAVDNGMAVTRSPSPILITSTAAKSGGACSPHHSLTNSASSMSG